MIDSRRLTHPCYIAFHLHLWKRQIDEVELRNDCAYGCQHQCPQRRVSVSTSDQWEKAITNEYRVRSKHHVVAWTYNKDGLLQCKLLNATLDDAGFKGNDASLALYR